MIMLTLNIGIKSIDPTYPRLLSRVIAVKRTGPFFIARLSLCKTTRTATKMLNQSIDGVVDGTYV